KRPGQVTNKTTTKNKVVVTRGPDVSVIERESGRRIQQVPIERVRNIAPTGSFSRGEIRVDESSVRGRRVAEPVKEPIEQARARGGKRGANDEVQGGRGRRDRNNTAAPAPSSSVTPAPSAQRPDDTASAREKARPNRPAETSTRPQTAAPRTRPEPPTRRDARERRRGVSENPAPPPQQ